MAGLRLAFSMLDLTTLEGRDTPGKVMTLCHKAKHPAPERYGVGPVAAVCVYPNLVPAAKAFLRGSTVKVASVATCFPSGQSSLKTKLEDTRGALNAGADEIDMVIDRAAFLRGEYSKVHDEVAAVKQLCGDVQLKVILETGELVTYDNVRAASMIAMHAGGDFIKTSTGKVSPAATLPVTLVMLDAIRDFFFATGIRIGMKPAGGIRTAKQALHYLVMVNETLGDDWLNPDMFRLGASTLANDILLQIAKGVDGRYQSGDYFSLP
jgi:deoxyribose-phosphate aldolase